MAYQSDESGRPEIYVRPFPNVNEGLERVSNAGGIQPLWARSGRELFYLEPGTPSPDYARDPDSSGLGIRKNAVAL